MLMCNLGNGLKVRDVVLWVANALNVHSLCLLVDRSSKVLRLVSIDKLGIDAQSRKEDLQLVVGSAIEVGCGYDVVSCVRQSCNCHELSCLTRRGSYCSDSALQGRHSLLENIDGRLGFRSQLR